MKELNITTENLQPVFTDYPVNYEHPALADIKANPLDTSRLNDFQLMEEILFKDETLRANPNRWYKFGYGLDQVKKRRVSRGEWIFIAPFTPNDNLFLAQINHYAMWNTIALDVNISEPLKVADYKVSQEVGTFVYTWVTNSNSFACEWASTMKLHSNEHVCTPVCQLCPIWGVKFKTGPIFIPCVDIKEDSVYRTFAKWSNCTVADKRKYAAQMARIPWELSETIKKADFMQ